MSALLGKRIPLATLRKLGFETVGKSVLLGSGPGRMELRAGPDGVLSFNFDKLSAKDGMLALAALAEHEARIEATRAAKAPKPKSDG